MVAHSCRRGRPLFPPRRAAFRSAAFNHADLSSPRSRDGSAERGCVSVTERLAVTKARSPPLARKQIARRARCARALWQSRTV